MGQPGPIPSVSGIQPLGQLSGAELPLGAFGADWPQLGDTPFAFDKCNSDKQKTWPALIGEDVP